MGCDTDLPKYGGLPRFSTVMVKSAEGSMQFLAEPSMFYREEWILPIYDRFAAQTSAKQINKRAAGLRLFIGPE